MVEVAPGVSIRMMRRAVVAAARWTPPPAPPARAAPARPTGPGRMPGLGRQQRRRIARRRLEPAGPQHLVPRRARPSEGQRALAPPTTTSRPGRLLAALVALIVVLLLGVLGGSSVPAGELAQPVQGRPRPRPLQRHHGDPAGSAAAGRRPSTQLQADMNTAQSIMNSRVNGAGFNGASVTTAGHQPHQRHGARQGLAEGRSTWSAPPPSCGSARCCWWRRNYATPGATPTPSATPTPVGLAHADVRRPARRPRPAPSPKPSRRRPWARPARPGSGSHGLAVSARPLAGARIGGAKAKPKASASPSPSPSPSASPRRRRAPAVHDTPGRPGRRQPAHAPRPRPCSTS